MMNSPKPICHYINTRNLQCFFTNICRLYFLYLKSFSKHTNYEWYRNAINSRRHELFAKHIVELIHFRNISCLACVLTIQTNNKECILKLNLFSKIHFYSQLHSFNLASYYSCFYIKVEREHFKSFNKQE